MIRQHYGSVKNTELGSIISLFVTSHYCNTRLPKVDMVINYGNLITFLLNYLVPAHFAEIKFFLLKIL